MQLKYGAGCLSEQDVTHHMCRSQHGCADFGPFTGCIGMQPPTMWAVSMSGSVQFCKCHNNSHKLASNWPDRMLVDLLKE